MERGELDSRSCGYRAVLSGIGGDEFLGGVPDPRSQLADLIVQFKLVSFAKQLMTWSLIKRKPWVQLLWQSAIEVLPASLGQYLVEDAKVEPWIRKDFAKRTRLAVRQLDVDQHFGLWLPTRRSYVSGVVLMACKLAKLTPSVSALEEARYPYLDQNLIEFILSIPADQLLRPGERRSLMRRSLVRIVPQDILSRRTKQFGARTPVIAIGSHLEQLRMAFDSPLSSSLGYIDQSCFMENLNAAKNGRETNLVRLLGSISLELWLKDLAARRLIDTATMSALPGRCIPLRASA